MFIKIVSIFIFYSSYALADNWSINQKKELPAIKDQNRIIKWCDKATGKKTRYASANIELSGYEPCGSLHSVDVCDANGNKFLGPVPEKGIFTQCKATQKSETIIDNSSIEDNASNERFNDDQELRELNREIKRVEKIHNADPEVKMQILTDNLIKGVFGKNNQSLSDLLDSKKQKEIFKQFVPILEGYTKLLDKDTKKAIEPLIEHIKKKYE